MRRIVVIGAGAMGSLYAGLLANAGHRVTVVDGWRERIETIRARGLGLRGITGDIDGPVDALTLQEAEVSAGLFDLAIVLVNTPQTARAAALARLLLNDDGALYGLQNGIGNLELYAAEVGRERVIGGLSYHSAALRSIDRVEHTHKGPTWLGALDGRRGERIDELAALLASAGFDPHVVDDIEGHIWTKFIHNSAINPVCALLGLRVGEIPTTPGADELQTEIIAEALAVAKARGVTLADADPIASIKAFCRVKFNKPSMLQHMESARETEIDALNGAIVRYGRESGVPTPYNQALTWMIHGLQHHRMRLAADPAIDYDALERAAKARAPD